MDRIPTPKPLDHSKEVEAAFQFRDIQDRARAARPVGVGRDILKAPIGRDVL